jgi:hypothetical protein
MAETVRQQVLLVDHKRHRSGLDRNCAWGVLILGLAMILLQGCLVRPAGTTGPDISGCLKLYHAAAQELGPAADMTSGVIHAPPCEALSPAGDQRWFLLVVARDDITIRIYFLGGLLDERCDLLRSVNVQELPTAVSIRLEAGADPALKPASACSAGGQNYVTQIRLANPLHGRSLSGPNNDGQIQHL